MAVAGDILEQPETGWTRYKRSEAVEIGNRLTHSDCLSIDWDSYISKSYMIIEPSRGNNFKMGTKIRLIGSTLIAESQVSVLVGYSGPPNTVASFSVPANIDGTNVMLAEFTVTEEMAAGDYIQIQLAGEMLYAIDVVNPTPTFEVMNIQPDSVEIAITLVERGQFRYTTVIEESGLVPTNEQFTYGQINYAIDIPYEGEVYTVKNIDRYRTSLTSGTTGLIANTRYITYFYVDSEDKVYSVPFTTADLPKVTASLPSGTYTAPQTIELSCEVENTEIRYLAYNKGEEPAIEDVEMNVVYNLYSEPFEVTDNWDVVIYAQGYYKNTTIVASNITTFEYTITEETEEEEDMKEIMLGLIFLKLRVVGTTEWTEIGDSKTEAKFKFEEKFADVKTVESGNVDKVLESTTASLEVGISQLSKALIDKLSASINSVTEGTAPNEVTYLEGGAGIGSVATKYEVIAHPIEEGTGTEYDIYLPKATIETSIDKTGKAGDQLVFNLKIEGLYDREQKCKFRIGKNPA